jgi:2-succinyl-5-enolpyruvyl-6-hydroxy-3-cyclohexene-1-carboxylate synthase
MQQHVFTIARLCESAGIQHAVICPGSRSAPLVYAFTQSAIKCHSVVDERSAAYIALGMAQQSNKPVVLICTSGTAALNFFPAIAEAFYQQIPLLVLTADRPPELMNQQDGQMIMQRNMYGTHVKASFELPCFAEGKESGSETTTIMSKAISACVNGAKGPVHVNIPLAEPLYPGLSNSKFQPLNAKQNEVESAQEVVVKALKTIGPVWQNAKRKLVLIGQMPCNAALTGALHELQNQPDVVIVCDILSNQYQYNTALQFDYLLMRSDSKIQSELAPDCIISLGGPVLSKALKKWIQGCKLQAHFRFNTGAFEVDTYKNATHHFEGDSSGILFQLGLTKNLEEPTRYKQFWQTANKVVADTVGKYAKQNTWSELHAMNAVLDLLPDAANVQVGNSSVIRYVSYLGNIKPSWVLNGNRGTSGIDGCTSTAVGAALVNNRPTFLLTGDIAFLYDNNALWNKLPDNLKIIIFNNNGGGIFKLIDGPSKHKDQLPYFTTPHTQNIQALAQAKGIAYTKATSIKELISVSKKFFDAISASGILELTFDLNQNSEEFKRFKQLSF